MATPTLDRTDALQHFEDEGYVIFRDVLDSGLIAEAGEHVAWLQERYPDRTGEELSHELVAKDAFWVRLVSDPRLLDIAELFVGPDISLFASHYIAKAPFSGKAVLWHQDGAFWPLEPMKVVTLWLAVDDSTPENGCLRVVPGSHRNALLDMRDRPDVESVLGAEIEVDVDEADAADMVMTKGSVEVHHPNIIHGSNANTSPNRRAGLTIRYIPTSTRIMGEGSALAASIHLRGAPGVNPYQPRPTYVPGDSFPFAGSEAWQA
ncbi:MAG TPA: phytanoyl-CoA dioxygenase family protein [Actinomycetales bacterium]|jgi:hypothetical protein